MTKDLLPPSLQGIIDKIEKDYGKSIYIGDLPEFEFIPFSSPSLNYLTRGGVPFGVSTEIVGEEHSGKSTLAQDLIKNFQTIESKRVVDDRKRLEGELAKAKTPKQKETIQEEIDNLFERRAVYLDIEQTLSPHWLNKLGVDESKVLVYKPSDVGIEGPLEEILDFMRTGYVGMVIIDSVGQMISTAEHDSNIGKGNYGGISKSLTKYYKMASPIYARNKIAHVVINQTRQDLAGYGQLVRPGGNAHKFAQSVVLRLRPGALLNEKYETIPRHEALVHARETIVNMVKNKAQGADRQTISFTIRPNYGIDVLYDASLQAEEENIIVKGGAWYTLYHPDTGEQVTKLQGRARVMNYLEENEEYRTRLLDKLYELAIKEEY